VSDMRNKYFRKIFPKIKQQFTDFLSLELPLVIESQLRIEIFFNQNNGGAFMINTHQN
jgi:hypothetical protein